LLQNFGVGAFFWENPVTQTPPQATYQARLQQLTAQETALLQRDAWLAHARLACALLFVGLGVMAYQGFLAPQLLAVPAAIFVGLAVLHDRVIRAKGAVGRIKVFYQDGLLRLDYRHPPHAPLGPPLDGAHPYALDLDLFGATGLFGLLCTATTSAGQRTLAQWLAQPPTQVSTDSIVQRQQAVQALRSRLTLREDLSTLGERVRGTVHDDLLTHWAEAPAQLQTQGWHKRLWACHAALLAAGGGYALQLWGPGPALAVLAVQWGVGRAFRPHQIAITAALEEPRRELPVLAQVIARLRREPLPDSAALQAVLRPLHTGAAKKGGLGDVPAASAGAPSCSSDEAIAQLDRLGQWFDAQKNQLFAPLGWLLLWGPHFALWMERWRQQHGPQVRGWLTAVGEFEALLSLGGYAYERPDDVFAEVVDAQATLAPLFVGKALGHPLLPPDVGVCNDVHLDATHRLLIVSGSNMSGKSTLLRTVGLNAVLALCGAPVRARSLMLSPLRVGATLCIQDSLQTGTSRFYAELKRLRQLKEATTGPVPLLFLLDEILHGTNSHDRAVGAAALLQSLLGSNAIGLVTTHDLSLSRQAEVLQARNVHFADDWVDGALRFDYRMRDGVVQKSNALALMQQAGLL
jgi:hypothetical protein